jgi:integrase/recombinase XerD
VIYLLVILCFQIGGIGKAMSTKVTTLLKRIDPLHSKDNVSVVKDFYNYMREKGSSENHIINNLKVMIEYVNYLDEMKLYDVEKKDYIIPFLNTKIKNGLIDPDKRWITTWNHYLNRLKLFFRWLHNYHKTYRQDSFPNYDESSGEDWITPDFIKIKQKQTKRLSPYSETEIWERNELLTILKYESLKE